MRRKDREVTQPEEVLDIINGCQVLRIGMISENMPYIVPLNFGYQSKDGKLEFYFHSAKEGKKLDIWRENPAVCFEMDCNHELIVKETACGYGFSFASVMGHGRISFLEDASEKAEALSLLMRHIAGKEFVFTKAETDTVAVYKLTVDDFSAKAQH